MHVRSLDAGSDHSASNKRTIEITSELLRRTHRDFKGDPYQMS